MPTTSLTLILLLLATFLPTPEVLRLQSPLGRVLWRPEAHGVRNLSFYSSVLELVTKIKRDFSGVMDKQGVAPTGNKHDYLSWAP